MEGGCRTRLAVPDSEASHQILGRSQTLRVATRFRSGQPSLSLHCQVFCMAKRNRGLQLCWQPVSLKRRENAGASQAWVSPCMPASHVSLGFPRRRHQEGNQSCDSGGSFRRGERHPLLPTHIQPCRVIVSHPLFHWLVERLTW